MAALRELVEGDCGAANPLVRWSTHFHQQKPLAHGGVRHDRLQEIARPRDAGQLENELVNEFLGETQPAVPQTFNMSSLLSELKRSPLTTSTPSPLTHHLQQDSSIREWVDEFAPAPPTSVALPLATTTPHHSDSWAEEFTGQVDKEAHDWSQQFAPSEDEKWADEFRDQAESKELAAVATEMSTTVTDPKIQATEFMDFVRKLGKGEVTVEGGEVKGQSTVGGEVKGQATRDVEWAEDFVGESERETEEMGYWGQLEREWQELAQQKSHPWLDDFVADEKEQKAYLFQEENHLREVENALEEGKKRLREGDLPSAVLLFEAEVQRHPESIEGWQYLGTTQANNEQELAAIAALQRCLELNPASLPAHLTLAVSYTNESQQRRALKSLKNWLYHNPKYSSLIPGPSDDVTRPFVPSLMSKEEHAQVCDLFLRAAQLSPEQLDPDMQVCLGVLYNLSSEFDKAVDCFTAALQTRPDDALLWNKLGATLANSSRSEEAVHAYRQALGHMPGFTRCRYNLGISCINLKAYREAVEHFLTALNHQRLATTGTSHQTEVGGASQMSEAIWSTLRLAVTFLGQSSLIPILEARNLDALLAEFGLAKHS